MKTHLTFAVREEVEVLRQTIAELEQRVRVVVLFYLYSFFTLRFRLVLKCYKFHSVSYRLQMWRLLLIRRVVHIFLHLSGYVNRNKGKICVI